jgi:UDP-3-O-[3-hydroxymyristoyl] glucosamine N-acyltransferase
MKIHSSADVSKKAKIGKGTVVWNNTQIREGAEVGENCVLGKNVYLDQNVKIGSKVKVQNNTSVYQGVTLEDGVFVGPHVCFTNDKNPRAINPDGTIKDSDDWVLGNTIVKKGASIGGNATILPDITIGKWALVGAVLIKKEKK